MNKRYVCLFCQKSAALRAVRGSCAVKNTWYSTNVQQDSTEQKEINQKHSQSATKNFSSKNFEDHVKLVKSIEQDIGIQKPEDWVPLSSSTAFKSAEKLGIASTLNSLLKHKYNSSLWILLKQVYPSVDIVKQKHQKLLLAKIEKRLNVHSLDEWKMLDFDDARRKLEKNTEIHEKLLELADGNLLKLVEDCYREKIAPVSVPDKEEQALKEEKEIIDKMENHLGIQSPADWYNLSVVKLKKSAEELGISKEFTSLLRKKHGLFGLLSAIHPSFTWENHKFAKAPKNSLSSTEEHWRLIKKIETELGFKSPLDWYKMTRRKALEVAKKLGIEKSFRSMLVNHYKGSLIAALKKLYPSESWESHRFERSPTNYFQSASNQLKVMKELEPHLNITTPEDWHRVSTKQVRELCKQLGITKVETLLTTTNGSLFSLLKQVYPQANWDSLKRVYLNQSNSMNFHLLREAVKTVERELLVNKPEDWYRVSQEQIRKVTKLSLFKAHGGVAKVLPMVYPSANFNASLFGRPFKSQQRLLLVTVKKLLGEDTEVIEEYRIPDAVFEYSKEPMELDIYVPKHKLAFEYHGAQHYREVLIFKTLREYQYRDTEKKEMCQKLGITLIEVPYTWDSSIGMIAGAISEALPGVPLRNYSGQ